MVFRLSTVDAWKALPPDQVLTYQAGGSGRKVRLEVNTTERTRFDLAWQEGTVFLANVMGHEVLEFSFSGECSVVADPGKDHAGRLGEVFYCVSTRKPHHNPEAATFTTLETRRVRNPEQERAFFKMEQNATRRINMALRELEARAAKADPETGEVKDEVARTVPAVPKAGADTAAAGGASDEVASIGGQDGGGEGVPAKPGKPAGKPAKPVPA